MAARKRNNSDLVERILEQAKVVGLSPRAASIRAGLGATFIRDLARRPTQFPSVENLEKLAKALGTNINWLTHGHGPTVLPEMMSKEERETSYEDVAEFTHPQPLGMTFARFGDPTSSLPNEVRAIRLASIIGEVAGGVWSEPSLSFQEIQTEIPRDPKWPDGAIYLLRVRGNSINRQAKDGDLVLCLDYASAPRKFRNGDWVIVERERGGLIETTVKKVSHAFNGEWMLEPSSDDSQHQAAYSFQGAEDYTIRVRAFVLDFIREGTRL